MDHLFDNSKSRKPLPTRSIAHLLYCVIEEADPGHSPQAAHSIRGLAVSLVILRTHSVAPRGAEPRPRPSGSATSITQCPRLPYTREKEGGGATQDVL